MRLELSPDPAAWFFAVLCGGLVSHDYLWLAGVVAVVAGMIAPKAPVFVALWTFSPVPLIGLIPVVIGYFTLPKGEITINGKPWDKHWLKAMTVNGPIIHDFKTWLLPWGAGLAAFFGGWETLPAVVVAYAQTLIATDRLRLYMWAAPVVVFTAVRVIPAAFLPAAIAVTWFGGHKCTVS